MAFWYTRAMTESERDPTPLTAAVWPPAPLRDEPPPLLLRVEGMQLTRSGDRLVVINRSIRRGFFAEVCIVSTSLFSPWISFWRNPFHHAALLPYVLSGYRSGYGLYLFMLCLLAGVWCWFTFLFNLGGVTLDKRAATIKADGRRARPMSRIEAVHIKSGPNQLVGRQYTVRLLWSGGRPTPDWEAGLTGGPANSSFLGSFRHEANADQVAGIIAAFIGVPVQKMNGICPPPERDQRS